MNATTVLLLWAAAAPAEMRDAFTHDFRRGEPLPPVLRVFGPDSGGAVKQEADGLRITLPAKRPNLGAVGVSPHFTVSGDFEISVAFEIPAVEPPTKGYGSGVSLHLILDSPKEETLTVARSLRLKEGAAYFINRDRKDEGNVKHRVRTFPAQATAGRLCLRRVGSTVHYLAVDAVEGDLRELDQADVGTENVRSIRVAANTGGSPTALDVRLLELRIGSEQLPNQPAQRSLAGALWIVSTLAGVGLLSIVGVVMYRRRNVPLPPEAEQPSNQDVSTANAKTGKPAPSKGR